VVAGVGRSGTSLFAGLMSRLGVLIPKPEVAADRTNPRGFSEPRWAVEFHKGLLKKLGVTIEDGRPEAWQIAEQVMSRQPARERLTAWLQDQVSQSDGRIIVKDPRLAWFLALYRDVAKELGLRLDVVTMLRPPGQALKSHQLAYGTNTTTTTRMAGWLNMMLFTEERTRDLPRVFVRYEDLLTDWSAELERVGQTFGLRLLEATTPEQRAYAGELVDSGLRRSTSTLDELGVPPDLQQLAEKSYAALSALCCDPADSQAARRLDECRDEYVTIYRKAEEITRSTVTAAQAKARTDLNQLRQQGAGPVTAPAGPSQAGVHGGLRHVASRLIGMRRG
jgi:hypothetical protein